MIQDHLNKGSTNGIKNPIVSAGGGIFNPGGSSSIEDYDYPGIVLAAGLEPGLQNESRVYTYPENISVR